MLGESSTYHGILLIKGGFLKVMLLLFAFTFFADSMLPEYLFDLKAELLEQVEEGEGEEKEDVEEEVGSDEYLREALLQMRSNVLCTTLVQVKWDKSQTALLEIPVPPPDTFLRVC